MTNAIETIEKAEIEGLKTESNSAIEQSKKAAREIKDADSLEFAAHLMLKAKSIRNKIIERLSGPKKAARAAWQGWIDLEDELTEPYRRIENDILKPAISLFSQEQDRKRRIEEDKLREEARKREEDERLRKAEKLEAAGHAEMANAVLDTPAPIAPIVLPKIEQPKGISYREVWKFRLVDISLVPREYLVLDETKIGGVVRALKGDTRIPGIEPYAEKVVAGRV